jgi:hypothetical protein
MLIRWNNAQKRPNLAKFWTSEAILSLAHTYKVTEDLHVHL